MNVLKRIKLAGAALVGKSTGTLNEDWLTGRYVGDVRASRGTGDSYTDAYTASAIAYACIDRMAKDAAGVPLVYVSDPEDFQTEVGPDDKVRRWFERPAQGFTTRRLVGWTTMMRQLRGECFWLLDYRGGKQARGFIPWIDPRQWREKVSTDQGLWGWEYQTADDSATVPASDVLWIGQDNPGNPYRGVSPLKAAARAVGIDAMGDTLQQDMITRGGERGIVAEYEHPLTDEQYNQLLTHLAARRPGGGQASRDFILEGGLKLGNPDFTKEDIDILAWQGAAKDKICHVYGMAPVLIGDDDAAQFKSAPEAIKLYWQQTLVPLLKSYEDAWDRFFVETLQIPTYVRFDLSKVAALQEDQQELASIARQVWDMGVSFAAVNQRYGLGFDDETAEMADAMPRIPAQFGGDEDDEESKPEPEKRLKGLTNDVIRKRAVDSRFIIQRQRQIARLERGTIGVLRGTAKEYQDKTLDAVKSAVDEHGMTGTAAMMAATAVREMALPFGSAIEAACTPAHREAAEIGSASIQELVDGKFLAWHDRRKALFLHPETEAMMLERGRWLRDYSGPGWIDEVAGKVVEAVKAAGEAGESISTVTSTVRQAWAGWSKGRAETIARTEVGTMYNTARFNEMPRQGFEHHEWVTSIDEATRESHYDVDGQVRRIGQPFDIGGVMMTHPQANGAPAGEVINCRCETIPVVED